MILPKYIMLEQDVQLVFFTGRIIQQCLNMHNNISIQNFNIFGDLFTQIYLFQLEIKMHYNVYLTYSFEIQQ